MLYVTKSESWSQSIADIMLINLICNMQKLKICHIMWTFCSPCGTPQTLIFEYQRNLSLNLGAICHNYVGYQDVVFESPLMVT